MSTVVVEIDFPAFECRPGCHECCGMFPVSVEELARIREYLPAPMAMPDLLPGFNVTELGSRFNKCAFLAGDGCTVYPVRPLICRAFGCVEGLACSYGCGAEEKIPRRVFFEYAGRYLGYCQLEMMITRAGIVAARKMERGEL